MVRDLNACLYYCGKDDTHVKGFGPWAFGPVPKYVPRKEKKVETIVAELMTYSIDEPVQSFPESTGHEEDLLGA